MHDALNCVIANMPAATKVYCGHEYTLNNLKFAASVEPDNTDIRSKLEWAESCRVEGRPTIPSSITDERKTNPFMRLDQPAVLAFAARAGSTEDPVSVMKTLREQKNQFGLGSGST